jgi:arginyl-tRNA synthetase
MLVLADPLKNEISKGLKELFEISINPEEIQLQPTRKEFEGQFTMVTFPFTKKARKNPVEIGKLLGNHLLQHSKRVSSFQVVKGFLNLSISNAQWNIALEEMNSLGDDMIPLIGEEKLILIEFSSPNTNKPLHLGHLRNIFLGQSVSNIYKCLGYRVQNVQIINDRGIHICKSMVAWREYGKGEDPSSTDTKGDHLVGKYYVRFNQEYIKEVEKLQSRGMEKEEAEKKSPIMIKAQELLLAWEKEDPETLELWKKMNSWVYEGFDKTYERMGAHFDHLYFESDTYLKGKEIVEKGVEKRKFFQKDDGSIWVDLKKDGLDEKLLVRSDGTSVYMTQDIGTAIQRYEDYPELNRTIYTVGNEQDYHFKVLFLILARLGYDWAELCFHLSYGMVDLPTGKMKSREGTVVDADDLMEEMHTKAEAQTRELGKIEDLDSEEAQRLFEMVGMAALKYFLLRTDPKKRILFDPEESIQFQGHTGPFIQYTYARIISLLNKAKSKGYEIGKADLGNYSGHSDLEKELLFLLASYPEKIIEAANTYNPSVIAHFCFDLSKEFNRFYAESPIVGAKKEEERSFRLALSKLCSNTIFHGMELLGIEVPKRM